ncbi:MAG: nucleotidyltransferase domain-containing protein [Candidatus Methanoperedens sp.]|nr:nucleotidyltransferase domain-containing protein [Candidatus Methanoperedens sp.]
MLSQDIEKKIISELKDIIRSDLRSIILFGSYAKGTAQTYSDIDILVIPNRKFAKWTERRDLEMELRKRLYRTVGQVSPKIGSIEELRAALDNFNPLILNIPDSGVPSYADGTFDKLKEHFKRIVSAKIMRHTDYWGSGGVMQTVFEMLVPFFKKGGKLDERFTVS